MNHQTAKNFAVKISQWLQPNYEKAVVAGSIRRGCPVCNDIDLVVIPKIEEEKDMLGAVVSRKNHLFLFIKGYAALGQARIVSGGDAEGKQMIIELKKCQLDLWFADEKTFATRLLCRTGSMEHNVWLAQRAKRQGLKWAPYNGILSGGQWRSALGGDDQYIEGALIQFSSEEAIYAALGLPFIEPKNRELPHLVKNYGQ